MNPILIERWRGKVLECVHAGRYAVVDGRHLLTRRGDIQSPVYLRSSAKPFQAWTVVDRGAADAFHFSESELAVVCGSHGGDPVHVDAVKSILKKAGLKESDLRCGTHAPTSPSAQKALAKAGREATALHNNCSGKHAGMVAAAKKLGAPTATYLDPGHPLQKLNRQTVADFAKVRASSIGAGVDGCGAPTFAIPLVALARAFAGLTAPNVDDTTHRITRAMVSYPVMVGRPCQDFMTAGKGEVVGKIGADGVYAAGLVGRGIGVAVKIDDGAMGHLVPLVVTILKNLRLLSNPALNALVKREIRNHAGTVVGTVRFNVD